eukprot:3991510-Pyramimonas_sp.AAC.2
MPTLWPVTDYISHMHAGVLGYFFILVACGARAAIGSAVQQGSVNCSHRCDLTFDKHHVTHR